MSSVDERVVEMKFDNKSFEANVSQTLTSLDKLNKGLKLEGATKGLNDVSQAASRFSIAGIASGVENISSKFTALGVLAVTTLANIATRAVTAGISLVKSLSLDPVLSGLNIYETKLNSIQTILANTSGDHTTLKNVTDALAQLNTYSNQTIYNFGEMARNIGTFTAAGLKLDASVSAIKGIANLAAISGSSADQASTAMYQLSQALASGTVKLQDWNSVVNAGMGGKVFQQALMETARVHGVAIDKMVKEEGGFRNTLQKGWLTSQILAETLSHFAGDLNDQQLKAQGYTTAQIKQLHELAQTAQDAATKVKTFPQLMDVLKETVASGWAQSFEILFGNIDEAKTLFTNINNVIGGFITTSSNARNKVLGDWKALGGRTALIQGITNVFHALSAVIKPIHDAFRDIFPATTGKQLYDLTIIFENFTKKLKIGAQTAGEIHRIFAGFFAILDIGWQIIKKIGGTLADLFGMIDHGNGGFLSFLANIGDFFVAVDKAIKSGQGLSVVFQGIENDLAPLIKLFNLLRGFIGGLFSGFDATAAAKGLTSFAAKLAPFLDFTNAITYTWSNLLTIVKKVWSVFQPLASKIGKFFSGLAHAIGSAFAGVNYKDVLGTINTGLFAGLLVLMKSFISKMKSGGASSGLFDGIKEALDGLTNTFKTMQNTLRAATLLEIAAAIGIMTIACVALSKIDTNGLTRALSAMAVMFVQLGSGLFALEKTMSDKNLLKLYLVNGALIAFAIAIDILLIAVVKLSKIPLKQLRDGLIGLGVLLAEIVTTMKMMPNPAGLVSTSVGIGLLAIAINILVTAVGSLGGMSWDKLSKGLVGVAGLLVSLALFTKFAKADATGALSGAGIVLLAAGIKILASAMQVLATMGWGEIAKSLTVMLGALAIISAALYVIPPSAPLAAAGVLVVALGLSKIAVALSIFGSMGWGEIGKGLTSMLGAMTIISLALAVVPPSAPLAAAGVLVIAIALGKIAKVLSTFASMGWGDIGKAMTVLAGSLTLITAALIFAEGAIPGAAAVLIMAGALAVLTPILVVMGSLSWVSIIKALVTLAGVFVVLGAAGLLLGPLAPVLLALGAAVVLMGVGMLAAGVGVLAFSAGLTALSVSGAAATAAIVAIVSGLVGLLPYVAQQLGLAVIAFAKIIANSGPAIMDAIVTVLTSFMDAIIKLTPKIVQTLQTLIDAFLGLLVKNTPKIVEAGFKMLLALLDGISNHIGQVVTKAVDIVVKLIEGITKSLPRLLQAGVTLILGLISGIGDTVKNNGKAMADAAWNLVTGIIDGLVSATGELAKKAWDAAVKLVKGMWNAALDWLGINSPSKKFIEIGKWSVLGLAKGLINFTPVAQKAAVDMASSTVDAIGKTIATIPDVLPDSMNLNPTITPVLDLSKVQKDASQLNGMLPSGAISLDTSVTSARNAGSGFQNNVDSTNSGITNVSGSGNTVYNQYNNSPKPLSSAEIYRQTQNQLSATRNKLPTTPKGVVVV